MGIEFLAQVGDIAGAALTRLLCMNETAARSDPRPGRSGARPRPLGGLSVVFRGLGSSVTPAIQRYLEHLRVERRVSAHTLTAYGDALARLVKLADEAQRRCRRCRARTPALRRAAARPAALGARSIALTLSGWRGFYRWWSLQAGLGGPGQQPGRRHPAPAPPAAAQGAGGGRAVALATAETAHRRRRRGRIGGGRGARGARPRDRRAAVRLRPAPGRAVGPDIAAGAESAGWIDIDEATAHVFARAPSGAAYPSAARPWRRWQATCSIARRLAAGHDSGALFVSRPRQPAVAQPAALAPQGPGRPRRRRHARAPAHAAPQLRVAPAAVQRRPARVQELLGHASIATTQVYTRLDFQHLAKVYDAAHPRARCK